MTAVFHDVEMNPGTLKEVGFRRPLIVRRPALLVESVLAYRLRSVVVTSIRFEREEQLAVEGVPAALFEELAPHVVLPPLCAGDELKVGFANHLGAPIAAFRIWFGELHELRKLRNPPPECEPGTEHMWHVEPGHCSRVNRCANCGALWVGEAL